MSEWKRNYKDEVGFWIDWGRWKSFGKEPWKSGEKHDLADEEEAGVLGASLCNDNDNNNYYYF